jgi:hypothetical protein
MKESSFGAETWLITQNLKPEKGCVIQKLSSPSSKVNGIIFISKNYHGKLSWDHKHLLVLDFLDDGDTVTAVHVAYGGHFLQKASVTLPKCCPLHEKARPPTPDWTYSCLWLYIL